MIASDWTRIPVLRFKALDENCVKYSTRFDRVNGARIHCQGLSFGRHKFDSLYGGVVFGSEIQRFSGVKCSMQNGVRTAPG
jgi:hypothetical protein